MNDLEHKAAELDAFKKMHEKDVIKFQGQIDALEQRIPTLESSIKSLEDDLRKAKIDLEGEARVCIILKIVYD